jgi:glycolate oxidase
VLPTGEIIWTGANTLKYSTGYNLTHLFIGSEGTLGIVTKIVLKVISLPTYQLLLLASFDSAEQACRAVTALFKEGCNPSVCEFIEPLGFELSSQLTGISFPIPEHIRAYLLIEVDGHDLPQVEQDAEKIFTVLENSGCVETLFADSEEKKEIFWRLRRTIGEATKRNNVYKEEDTVVPRAFLPQLYTGVKEIAARYGVRTVCYGHAGDGNLHVNILKDNLPDEFWQHDIKEAIREIFLLCKKLGGTLSGEHGIGYVQQEFMPLLFPDIQLELMKKIKLVFDPNNILNPGKIFNAHA